MPEPICQATQFKNLVINTFNLKDYQSNIIEMRKRNRNREEEKTLYSGHSNSQPERQLMEGIF